MANLFGQEKKQELSPREALGSKYQGARHNILLVVVFTVINIILLVTNSSSYFLFSASIPYFLVDLGMLLGGKYPEEYYLQELGMLQPQNNGIFVAMLAVAGVILVLYLLSWIFSKKPRVGWMIFALVFFALDTVGMLVLTGVSSDMIIDVVFHGWVIVSLIGGVSAYFKAKKLPQEEVPQAELPQEEQSEDAVIEAQ